MSEFYDPDQHVKRGRHNLPHWHQDETWIFITWRLADSLPTAKLEEWKQQKEAFHHIHPQPWDRTAHIAYRKLITDEIEAWLDKGYGKCQLKLPEIRDIASQAFLHFHQQRYTMRSFVIMPNHVHLLLMPKPQHQLSDIVHSLKSFTANKINRALSRKGQLWQTEFHDRLIRSQTHFDWADKYIQRNPAKLVKNTYTLWSGEQSGEPSF